jgi:magnesium transporter
MLTTRQNEIIKNLTIMAFITFPLTLLSSMFGMNTTSSPILGHPADFWIIVGIMLSGGVGFFTFFKYKRWL